MYITYFFLFFNSIVCKSKTCPSATFHIARVLSYLYCTKKKNYTTTRLIFLHLFFVSFVSFHLFLISFVSFRLTVVLSINIFYILRSSKMCSCKSDCPPISTVGIKSTPDPSVVVHLTSESEIHALLLHSTASKDTLMS